MARVYSRSRGRSGSKKPLLKTPPTWVRHKPKEVELLIAKLAKEGKTASLIGLHLRDAYGIPSVKLATHKRVSAIMSEKELGKNLPEDLIALIRKSVQIRKHIETNKKDQPAVRGLAITEAKISRLVKYYKRTEKLAPDFKFRAENARFYIE